MLSQTQGSAGSDTAESDPHHDRVDVLQGPPENGVQPLLSLPWLWPHGGRLPGVRQKQVLLEVRREGACCWDFALRGFSGGSPQEEVVRSRE